MQPELFLANAIIPALNLLPATMDGPEGRSMMLAIALQESRISYRRQIGGPARGYFQFEQGGGVHGVLTNATSRPYITNVLRTLDYDLMQASLENACWMAIEHNDILAAAFARLLLFDDSRPLPGRRDAQGGWDCYARNWRPGKPIRATWDAFYAQAWGITMNGGLQ